MILESSSNIVHNLRFVIIVHCVDEKEYDDKVSLNMSWHVDVELFNVQCVLSENSYQNIAVCE